MGNIMSRQNGTRSAQCSISRREQSAIDAKKLKETDADSQLCGFAVVENSDNVELNFRAVIGEDVRAVTICCSDDYPDNTVVTVEAYDTVCMSRATVAEAVDFVRGQLLQQLSPSPPNTDSFGEPNEMCDSVEDEDFDEYLMENSLPDVVEVNEQLLRDLEELRSFYENPDCAIFHYYSSLEHADIHLLISCASLQKLGIEAWALNADEPIIIKLSEVHVSHYRSTIGYPTVEVFLQSQQSKKSAVTRQLEFIIEKFMVEEWRMKPSTTSDDNVLMFLLKKVICRLPTLNDHCVLCDEEQQYKGMLMPTVCLNSLCVFRYQTLGVMADVAALSEWTALPDLTELSHMTALSAQPEVIDLLFEFLRAACLSRRAWLILDPYPTIHDPDSTVTKPVLAFDRENGTKGIERLKNVLVDVKCRRRLALGDYEYVSSYPTLLRSTVQWMLSSNRALLVKLNELRLSNIFRNCRQFLMLTDSPAKEAAFRKARTLAGGSTFLFHGSKLDNWHSILRKGLLVASGTKYQVHGAAYGPGIYLSDQLPLSFGYASQMTMCSYGAAVTDIVCCDHSCCAQVHSSIYFICLLLLFSAPDDADRFLRSKTAVVAVCEVIRTDALNQHDCSHIYTLKNAEHCCTRLLLVFEDSLAPNVTLDTETCAILRSAVADQMKRYASMNM
uniref:PARP catalytic domain-containing protein n=1 Tax=Plectus sambesii TaxID=2011161 RepID=A0A914URC9_9BILA